MKFITGYTLEELKRELSLLGLEDFRAKQVLKWLYKKFVTDFSQMTDLSKEHRLLLGEHYEFHPLERLEKVEAPDAIKYLFKTRDGHVIETVLIKERDHLTLCVSSQIGCAVGCTFCATAVDGLLRNLSTAEIIDQFILVQQDTKERIRNVVFMGMGEPLANYENVRRATQIMVSPWGLDLSKRRVTISTSGLIAPLRRMSEDPLMRELNLAVSINSPFQQARESIMPLTKTNTLSDLMELLKRYPLPVYRRITLEYVLIEGINDSEREAAELVKLIGKHKKRFKVNLIPFNPDPNLPYRRPALNRVLNFQRILWENGVSTFVRFSKGADVFGACGQLRAKRECVNISSS
ncbi:23S rRNA m(2)A-2503 methyltransferase [Hydrogenivirga caldilitoris]|uniref:Probable dual-specificity RNA methyltransferase RlmN n=1 Tax=Hydrogenivirga caldilitoris TaxID=246264 RepID=A0A497XP03_9AQUI|nr:23S rRNA (adenine(2503)-C(2))-methyltransferase RlmN [Hydrogenivirga caldilitoris]RLJ69991.1 23S rRNA m(2)A-2503 methyltransferase [Hydrogenivirga caldilitoris]